MGIIYLIKLREFIKTDENIFKIGRSSREGMERIKEYPKDSILYSLTHVGCNEIAIENILIKNFKNNFIHRTDIGNEYFEGNYIEMVYDINKIIFIYQRNLSNIIEYNSAFEIICFFNKTLREDPCNRTVKISLTELEVYTENGWEKKPLKYLDVLIKTVANQFIKICEMNKITYSQNKYVKLISEQGFELSVEGVDKSIIHNIFIESFK